MNVIGYLVWWNIDHPKILRERFNSLVSNEGLDIFVAKPKPRWAFSTALHHMKKKLTNREWHIQKIKQENFRKWYGVYDPKRTDVWDDLELKQVATIEFDMRSGELTCDRPHRSFEYFEKVYTWFCESVSYGDLWGWTGKMITSAFGLAVRSGGSIYFIPQGQDKVVQAMQRIINNTPKRCWLTAVPQVGTSELKHTINRFLLPFANKQTKEFHSWIYPKVRTIDITDVDTRLARLYTFQTQILLYAGLTDFDYEPYTGLVKEAIKRYRDRREEIYQKSPTKLQRIKYKNNLKRYPEHDESIAVPTD
jgi:hypothetical protein